MNQILSTEKKKKNNVKGKTQIKGIISFFAVMIIIFGIVLVGEGSYAMYRKVDDQKPSNAPKVTIGRINDKAIINVTHNVEIATITYYWDNSEKNVIPVDSKTAQEEITLLEYNSILHLIIEDVNGKQVNYQKQYLLEGVDITKPVIEQPNTENGSDKMTIIARDETAISYMSYQWDDEEPTIVDATEEGQTEIKEELTLTPGRKTLKIVAEDMNGNIDRLEKEIVISTSKPKMTIRQDGNQIVIAVTDQDGIKDITVNLNGERFTSTDINQTELEAGPLYLKEGNNIISIEVTNVSGYTEKASTELPYTPE